MNCRITPEKDIVYILPSDADRSGSEPGPLLLMNAKDTDSDRKLLGRFLHNFFGFSPGDARIPEKVILQHLNKGVFFLISKDEPVGMIRISATSRNYMVFTTMYITEVHRGKGLGAAEYAHQQGKIPQFTTSETNSIARRLYEKTGYSETGEYSYTFLPEAVF